MFNFINVLWSLLKKPSWFDTLRVRDAFWDKEIDKNKHFPDYICQTDDAAHRSNSVYYFEWWYFDVSLKNGGALSLIFHIKDLINPLSKKGSINIFFYDPNKHTTLLFKPYEQSKISASTHRCDVKIGKNFCKIKNDDNYSVFIDEENIKGELVFKNRAQSWKPGDGLIKFGMDSRYFGWVVPQPKSEVSGQIQIGEKVLNINDVGYHDHNWGNISLIESLSAWTWGRLYFDDFSFIYSDLHMTTLYKKKRVMPFILVHQNKIVISSFLQKNAPIDSSNDFLVKPHSNVPVGWQIYWQDGNDYLEIKIKIKQKIEHTDLLKDYSFFPQKILNAFVAQPYYLRSSVTFNVKMKIKDKQFNNFGDCGICEQMVLRPLKQDYWHYD